MKTIKQVAIEPVFVDGYMPDFATMEDNKIYISKEYGTSAHRCLCGCGQKTILPINHHNGSQFGWNFIHENNEKYSFTPSIQNPPPCNAHYIITNNIANILSYVIPYVRDTHTPGSCPL